MLKQQQFYTLKFSSDRLRKSKYNIDISLDNARINSEIISINNSELVRTIFRYKNVNFSQMELDNLLKIRKKLRKSENTEENREKLENITKKIEKILFIEDLVSIEFKHKSHYLAILKRRGFYINGIRFVPFMASAGMIRKNTALFINNNLKHPIMDILENERNEKVPMVTAKFGAYFSLYSSSTLPVSFPKFSVIPDKEIETVRRVDFVTYKGIDEDDDVTEQDKLLKLNAWDGQGLISPRLAEQWSNELELGYTLSCAVIRAPFIKGMVTVFDINKFASEIAHSYEFVDIYGNICDIRETDLVISESMFKLWNAYDNTQDYIEKCHRNKLGFGIAKVNPQKESSYSRTSYQFLQVLNLTSGEIAELCEPTVNWLRDICGEDPDKMIIYATGEHKFELKDFHKLDTAIKAIMINSNISNDRYIQEHFIKTINKKIKESYIGNILINANYQFMISDPYYQACHIFKLDKEPLLKDKEHYSEYWQNKGLNKLCAIRSPIVHHSEVNILNLQNREDTRYWYSHVHSGIIFPANGIGMDCAIHGGADFDGDLICTINNNLMIKGKIEGLPIIYESMKAEKVIVDSRDDKKQVECQLNGYNSKVGYATNVSSSLYSLLKEFPVGSEEHKAIEKRLKIGRVIQGEIIDGVKGLKVPPFRNHWVKYKKITPDMTSEEKEKWRFNNSILCEIRPAFFRYLYPHYMTRYNKEYKKYDIFSHLNFGKAYEIIHDSSSKTPDEKAMILSHNKHSYFLVNKSVVNDLCNYMMSKIKFVLKYTEYNSTEKYNYSKILMSKDYEINTYYNSIMKGYLQEYKKFKRGVWRNQELAIDNINSFISYLRKECFSNISTNEQELANYAVNITYGENDSMLEFAWHMFPNGILNNIIENSSGTIRVPVQSDTGKSYLWNTYTTKEIPLEDLYED